jgi:hypothetical protein
MTNESETVLLFIQYHQGKGFLLYIQTIMYQNINLEKRKGFEIILAYIIISLNF